MVVIRRARKEEIDIVANLLSRMYRLNSEFDPLLQVPEDLEERMKKSLEISMIDDNFIIVVAEEEGKIVGAARVRIANREFYVPEREGIIEEIYVHPSYRRRGIGEAIINYIQRELSNKGIKIISAHFPAKNVIAVSFYNKLGFIEEHYHFIKYISK
ncbi:MAG: GNAT family N-acetyltransferase [Sulfolobaceae archaeon]